MIASNSNPFIGVDPIQFVAAIEQQWIGFGNIPSDNLKENWRKMAHTFNQHLQNAGTLSKMMVYRFPLPTGGGKSTSLPRYLAMLGGPAETKDRCPGVIVTTQYMEECDRIAEEINRMGPQYGMKEPMAVALHSGVNRRGLKLPTWPFVITTQAGMTRALVEENNRELKRGFKVLPWLMQYENGSQLRDEVVHDLITKANPVAALAQMGLAGKRQRQRHMVIMDEMLSPFKAHNLTDEGIRLLIRSIPKELAKRQRPAMQTISEMLGLIALNGAMGEPIEDSKLTEADLGDWRERCASVVPLYKDFRDEYSGKGKLPKDNAMTYSEIMDTLTAIYNIKECNGTAALKQNGTIQSMFKMDWLMDRLKMGFVCLDATANESKLLDACEEWTTVKLKPCRDYKNLTIEVDTTTGTGRWSLAGNWKQTEERQETLNATVNRIVDLLRTVDAKRYPKVGLISFKPIIESLNAKRMSLPFELIMGYHGNVIGKNLWSECDLLYIIGLNNMVPTYGDEMMLGVSDHIGSLEAESRFTDVNIPDFKYTAEEVQAYDLLRDTIQVISRGSNRRTIDREGNCRESVVRIIVGSRNACLINGLKEHFRNVNIIENGWQFIPVDTEGALEQAESLQQRTKLMVAKAKSMGKTIYEAALHYFKMREWNDISLGRLVVDMDLAKSYLTKLKQAFQSEKYQSMMNEMGIRYSGSVPSFKHPNGVAGLIKS